MINEAFKCEHCRFFEPKTLTCHKNAPHPIPGQPMLWPNVKKSDWCGEFGKAPNFNIQEIASQKQRELDKKYEKYEQR
jgi:hypothetical protein